MGRLLGSVSLLNLLEGVESLNTLADGQAPRIGTIADGSTPSDLKSQYPR